MYAWRRNLQLPGSRLMRVRYSMRLLRSLIILLVVCRVGYAQPSASGPSSAGPSSGQAVAPQIDLALPSSVYVKVRIENTVKVSALKPGDVIEGKLAQDVYSGDRELFPSGSAVRLTVDKLGRRRRIPNDHWPWVIKFFTPRHENYPTFQSAVVSLPDGKEVPLRVALIFINRETEIRAQAKTKKGAQPAASATTQSADANAGANQVPGQTESKDAASKKAGSKNNGVFVVLEAATPAERATPVESSSASASPDPVTLATGTRAKIILLGGVSASKSRPGDSFQARLVEPVRLNSAVVLPEGTLLGGKVVARTPPRMLSRAGSILLSFTDLTLPGRAGIPAVASVTAAELDERSHTKIDPEGKMHGDRPGKAWMLINIGVTAGIAKVSDDTLQLIIEAIVSTATDASTAGSGRIAAICASGLFLLTRHGRDVVLPRFTEMNVVFDRPVSLAGSPASPAP
jgi:hypothetical protein